MKSFKNKIAVITGAGSGMGRELAYQLSDLGALVIISDKNKDTLTETANTILNKGNTCENFVVDVSDEKAISKFVTSILDKHHYIDILINNAGYALGTIDFKELKTEDFRKIVDVNLWGVILHTKGFIDSMLERPEASIVNISSLFGLLGIKQQTAYCTTKFAVRGFTEALRMELENTNITTTCVHPGGIDTNIVKNGVHYDDQKTVEELTAKFKKNAGRTSAKDAAKQIIKAIKNKEERLLIGIETYAADRLQRTMPVGYTPIIKRIFDAAL